MKYWFGRLAVFAAVTAAAWGAPLGEVRENGIIDVKTDHYALGFFPGHMFPFNLKAADGTALPEIIFLDRIVADRKQYSLRIDRFAETRIVENSDDRLTVEISGHYCLDADTSAPGRPLAVYRYECRRNSPEIKVSATVSREDDTEWAEVHFMQPGWRGNPFLCSIDAKGVAKPFAGKSDSEPAAVGGAGFLGLSDGRTVVGLAAPRVTAWNNSKGKYYSYLSAARMTGWKTPQAMFGAVLSIRPAPNLSFHP